ncbi:ABC transporter permease [Mesobacillus zeae]|uniref:Transport permease protein n=1 Tax=Mesobacillus zeae TaxID=1917180 RepID=A0A398BGB9_9BACI|nr:ABC transporter permease [Mesobacillus zeae]RID88787.1 ABC transporter permease [Mesobacillus zeae]
MLLQSRLSFTFLSFKALYSYNSLKLFIFFRFLDPFIHYLFFAMITTSIVGSEYLTYVILGNIAFYTGRELFQNFISIFRYERRFGTLSLNVAAPLPTFVILIKKSVVPLLDSLFIFIISVLMAYVMFDVSFSWQSFWLLCGAGVIMVFALFGAALLIAGISLLFSNVNLFVNLLFAGFQLLCGVNFPVSLLPDFLQNISNILPLTHSVELIRDIQAGQNERIYHLALAELSIGAVYFIIAILLIGLMEKYAKQTGRLFDNE